MRYPRRKIGEPLLYEVNSSGCAGGFTKYDALLSGLYEVIERDSFFTYWLHQITPKKISLHSIPFPGVTNYLEQFDHYGIKCYFLDLKNEFDVPTIGCVLVDSKRDKTVCMGASSGFDVKRIFLNSLNEALSLSSHLEKIPRFDIPADYIPFTDENLRRKERLSLWYGERVEKHMSFLLNGEEIDFESRFCFYTKSDRHMNTPKNTFVSLVTDLTKRGHRIFSHEIASPFLRKIGYHVSKVIIPTLIPLYLTEAYAPLAHPRIVSCPITGKVNGDINPYPHPFP
jgi:ribosomal protein S12 methylthiotransferase accessory factor